MACLMIRGCICQQRIPHTEGVHRLPPTVSAQRCGRWHGTWHLRVMHQPLQCSVLLTENTVSPATRGSLTYLVVAGSLQYCVCFWVLKQYEHSEKIPSGEWRAQGAWLGHRPEGESVVSMSRQRQKTYLITTKRGNKNLIMCGLLSLADT